MPGFYEKVLIRQGTKNTINIPNSCCCFLHTHKKKHTEPHSTLLAICEQAKMRFGHLKAFK